MIMLYFNICYIKKISLLITDPLTLSIFIAMCVNLKYIIKVFLYTLLKGDKSNHFQFELMSTIANTLGQMLPR